MLQTDRRKLSQICFDLAAAAS